jgi:arylsulfatase/uncharacterized sulfatase
MRHWIFCGAVLAIALAPQQDAFAQPAPNVVLIVVDDAAFMDFGIYGGEARTPNIDRLARRGAIFLNHHSSPLCSPSRAMLLTGVDSHRTGHATIEEVLPRELRGRPGYTLRLEPGVLTIAERLRALGYRTLMAGKWHLGRGEGDLPDSHGFDRSLALDASGADNYAQRPYMPYYDHAPWFENGDPATLPESFYSSDLLVDRLIAYIDEAPAGDTPFFAYLAFQAVHIPVQAPRSFSDNYAGRFDAGWEVLREDRWRRAREMGLTAPSAALNPLPDSLRRWASLSEEERRTYARSMEVYSGMLEAMDAAIGRLVGRIEARGELDRTVFLVTSDNGPEPSDPVHAPGMNIWMPLHGYHWDRETLGEPGSLAFIGPEWAASISSPHSLYKFYASEGGLRVPLIIAGHAGGGDARFDALTYVTDIVPTILELVGAQNVSDEDRVPISGRSLVPLLRGELGPRGPEDALGVEVSGNAALFRGDFKIVRNMPPVGDGRWRLYNLRLDPGETHDLSAEAPQLLADMLSAYEDYAQEAGVLALPEGYGVERQILLNSFERQLRHNALVLAAIGAVLLALLWLAARGVARALRART